MATMNVRELKRMLDHLADEALVVVATEWDDREIPVEPKWFFFDDRSKRLIIKGPLVYMDRELERDLEMTVDIRELLRGWERDDDAGKLNRLRDIAELMDRGD